jgi:hypothetical protein
MSNTIPAFCMMNGNCKYSGNWDLYCMDGSSSNSLQCDIAKTTFRQCWTVIVNM